MKARALAIISALFLAHANIANAEESYDREIQTLQGAIDTLEGGALTYAIQQIETALFNLKQSQKREAAANRASTPPGFDADLAELLPDAPPGWRKEIIIDESVELTSQVGGRAAIGSYTKGGRSIQITLIANHNHIKDLRVIFDSSSKEDIGGKRIRVRDHTVIDRNEELAGLFNNVFAVVRGGDERARVGFLAQMEFSDLMEW